MNRINMSSRLFRRPRNHEGVIIIALHRSGRGILLRISRLPHASRPGVHLAVRGDFLVYRLLMGLVQQSPLLVGTPKHLRPNSPNGSPDLHM